MPLNGIYIQLTA